VKRTFVSVAFAAVLVAGASFLPADAVKVPTSVTKVSVTCGTCVAPITCQVEDSCVLDYYNGYWRARQANGSIWVRLTLVNGN
jgi:hypothetical protein